MIFTIEELLKVGSTKNPEFKDLDPILQYNIEMFVRKLNFLGQKYKDPATASSFLRNYKSQASINPHAMKSAHLFGRAVDIRDEKKNFQAWIRNNTEILIECGFWWEDFGSTPTWVHLQDLPPTSGRREFYP
jgi:hypothetical protein